MRLAVATICPHVFRDGAWWSYEPFVLEMNVWCELFDEVIFIAPQDDSPVPEGWAQYRHSARISVVPFRRNRGKGLVQDRTSLTELPAMLLALARGAWRADALHVRTPCSIGLLGCLLGRLLKTRRCAKYAGQWSRSDSDARTVRVQKAILASRWWGAPVTVYGEWPDQPRHVIPLFTSVLNHEQMGRARRAAATERTDREPSVLFVGRLTPSKNVHVLVDAMQNVVARGRALTCTIVGDGPMRTEIERLVGDRGLEARVRLTGGLPFERVLDLYAESDVLVLASETEGWPKAIAEGMAFGLVCIGSRRGLVPYMLGGGRGYLVEPGDAEGLAGVLEGILSAPAEHDAMRRAAADWAQRFSLEGLREALRDMLEREWGLEPGQLGLSSEPGSD